ncbi:hypothetical protein VZT92_014475 [Zoarces viviparus]|uniref:Uncharacterized protein n=1 Tax=Zoarces viviparus TaxID=48416 RepID=A0AAW1EZ57_ZOAVI
MCQAGVSGQFFRCGSPSAPCELVGLVGIAPQVAERPVVPAGAMNSNREASSLHCVSVRGKRFERHP